MEIFCPNNHLILANQVCPKCGWKRPNLGEIGKLYWQPLELKTILGGVSSDDFTQFTQFNDNFLLATKNNELISVSLLKGAINWRFALAKGLRVTDLTVLDEKLYVTFQDTHTLIEGIKGGNISQLDEEKHDLNVVWKTSSHDLTKPLRIQDHIIIRTAESKVVALKSFADSAPVWERECLSWWPAPLCNFGGQVVYSDGDPLSDETDIIALDWKTGDVNWIYKIPNRPTFHLSGNDDYIVVVYKGKTMVVLDAKTGKEVFNQSLSRYYCRPVVFGETLLYTIRGWENDPIGHYQIHSYSLKESKFYFQSKLENRVRISPLLVDDIIFVADDKADIRAFSMKDGKEIRNLPGDDEDPIRTDLHVFNDQLVFGTYSGKVYSITVRQTQPEVQNPQVLIDQGAFAEAAAIYAMEGNWARAAEIYTGRIVDIDKALQLYEYGNMIDKAAKLAFDHNLFSRALAYYRSINDVTGEAKTLLAMGDPESASKLLYSLGDKSKAAELMEQAGKLSLAAKLYKESGRKVDYVRLIIMTSLDPSEVDELRQAGNFEVAADWQMKNGLYVSAAKDYKEAGQHQKELEALKQYLATSEEKFEPWMWQRLAELGEHFSDYLIAAKAWAKLDRPTESGEAYQKHAEVIAREITSEMDGKGILSAFHVDASKYFRLAVEAFHEAGIKDREEHCREMVRKYQLLPKVIVMEVKTATGLREMEWNYLTLTIKNIGYGRARQIKFKLNEDYFLVEADTIEEEFNLAPDLTRVQEIHIKPLREEIGDFVPLQIDWTWKDSTGKEYRDRFNNSVAVAKQREEVSSQPVNFVIHGDYVTQKGDRVDIIHGAGLSEESRLSISTNGKSVLDKTYSESSASGAGKTRIICPNKECKREIEIDANLRFCPYCKIPLR